MNVDGHWCRSPRVRLRSHLPPKPEKRYSILLGTAKESDRGEIKLKVDRTSEIDSVYEKWRESHFGGNNSGAGLRFSDPDGDGWRNESEWHFGSNPTLISDFPQPVLDRVSNAVVEISYRRARGLEKSLDYSVLESENLVGLVEGRSSTRIGVNCAPGRG